MNNDITVINTDVCIIGAGIIGMFLATKLTANKMSVVMLENGNCVGGQVNAYKEKMIYNLPLISSIRGDELICKMQTILDKETHCKTFLQSSVENIDIIDDGFNVRVFSKKTIYTLIHCKYLVLSFGKGTIEPNTLPYAKASEIEGKSLFYTVSDKNKFKNKQIIIAGGGNSVIDWGCELASLADKITIVHRREIIHNENPEFLHFKDLCTTGKIILKTHCIIKDLIVNNGEFHAISIANSDGTHETINGDYLLAFYGNKTTLSNINIYTNLGLKIENSTCVVNHYNNETNITNIFAVGDCCNFNGKVRNIFMGFADAMRCFYDICHRETGEKQDFYGH